MNSFREDGGIGLRSCTVYFVIYNHISQIVVPFIMLYRTVSDVYCAIIFFYSGYIILPAGVKIKIGGKDNFNETW